MRPVPTAMARELSQTTVLRIVAFLVDSVSILALLIAPATGLSYLAVWLWDSTWGIARIWHSTILIVVVSILLRDAYHGRSPGKRLMGLRVDTPDDKPCSWLRSIARNLPLVVPGWNVVEIWLLLFARDSRRSGDRIAGTRVREE
ncbi:MAG: RDD family protein [Acidobacteria bacterium]|nr:RDD family protein [Acidobacteriota bacterium]